MAESLVLVVRSSRAPGNMPTRCWPLVSDGLNLRCREPPTRPEKVESEPLFFIRHDCSSHFFFGTYSYVIKRAMTARNGFLWDFFRPHHNGNGSENHQHIRWFVSSKHSQCSWIGARSGFVQKSGTLNLNALKPPFPSEKHIEHHRTLKPWPFCMKPSP